MKHPRQAHLLSIWSQCWCCLRKKWQLQEAEQLEEVNPRSRPLTTVSHSWESLSLSFSLPAPPLSDLPSGWIIFGLLSPNLTSIHYLQVSAQSGPLPRTLRNSVSCSCCTQRLSVELVFLCTDSMVCPWQLANWRYVTTMALMSWEELTHCD